MQPQDQIQHSEGYFNDTGNVRLFEQNWSYGSKQRGTVIIVHGLVDHSGYYAETASILARQGFNIYSFDLRGHGKSEGPRSYVDSFNDYLTDLEIYHKRVADSKPEDGPLYIFGHSMGGAIVTDYLLSKTRKVDGVILSGAALKVGKDVSALTVMLTPLFSKLTPKMKALKLDINYVSRNPDIIAEKKMDPLIDHEKIPVRTAAELLKTIKRIQPNMDRLTVPVLIMHGTADTWTNPDGSRELYSRSKSNDKSLKLYDGYYHEILSDPERMRVQNDMVEWLMSHSTGNMR